MTAASQLRKARNGLATAQASLDDATAESRATAAAVEAAHKAVIARKPDAAALLQLRRADHDAAVIRVGAADESLNAARHELAQAENADRRERLAIAAKAANRAAVFARLRPALRALGKLRKWEIHQATQGGAYALTQTGFRMVEERPALNLGATEHAAALRAFTRDEKKRAKAMRTIASELAEQADAIATARQLAAELDQKTSVGNDETAPISWPHAFAMVALEQAPEPLTREWADLWFRHFGIFRNPMRNIFGAGENTLALARAAVTGEPEPQAKRADRPPRRWPADGSAPMPHPAVEPGDPRHPGSQRSALRGRGGYPSRSIL